MKLQQLRLLCWPRASTQSQVPLGSKTYALAAFGLLANRTTGIKVVCCNRNSGIGNGVVTPGSGDPDHLCNPV